MNNANPPTYVEADLAARRRALSLSVPDAPYLHPFEHSRFRHSPDVVDPSLWGSSASVPFCADMCPRASQHKQALALISEPDPLNRVF